MLKLAKLLQQAKRQEKNKASFVPNIICPCRIFVGDFFIKNNDYSQITQKYFIPL